jgi:hypothetical protein
MPFPRPSFDSVSCLRPQAAQPCGGRVTARKPSYLSDERRPDGMEAQRRRPVARNPTRGWEREATSSSAWCPVTPHDGWLRAPLPALAPATTALSSCPGGMEARRRHPCGSEMVRDGEKEATSSSVWMGTAAMGCKMISHRWNCFTYVMSSGTVVSIV